MNSSPQLHFYSTPSIPPQDAVLQINFPGHAANERTFLAWVRTAVAVIGFGLATGRLGTQPVSPWSEIALRGSGGLVVVLAFIRMRIHRRQINSDFEPPDNTSRFDLFLALLLISLFALMGMLALHLT